MQLGFVLDKTRCIGCHACTVACKSENEVPLGSFRTWVKYTEEGRFPETERSFTVLRCNQCEKPPCVDICPVHALTKRDDGIVDLSGDACIGCKSCMQACPYDALYLHPDTGTAQKCHFCAHRTEIGLAPACAAVCPTEAILPGDVHDSKTLVGSMVATGELSVRKPEAGTQPSVYYKEGAPAGIDPMEARAFGAQLFTQMPESERQIAELFRSLESPELARTVSDVDRPLHWGLKVALYLVTKSIAAGVYIMGIYFLFASPAFIVGLSQEAMQAFFGIPFVFTGITFLLLIADLKKPSRFFYILTRSNTKSWLVRGGWILSAFFATTAVLFWFALQGELPSGMLRGLAYLGVPVAVLTSVYTAFLFGQAKGRVLWMKRGLSLHLFAQAIVAGCAVLLILSDALSIRLAAFQALGWTFTGSMLVHLAFTLLEPKLAPKGREKEYAAAAHLISKGPYAKEHWILGVVLGGYLPILCLFLPVFGPMLAGMLALIGLFIEDRILIRAGQAQAIS